MYQWRNRLQHLFILVLSKLISVLYTPWFFFSCRAIEKSGRFIKKRRKMIFRPACRPSEHIDLDSPARTMTISYVYIHSLIQYDLCLVIITNLEFLSLPAPNWERRDKNVFTEVVLCFQCNRILSAKFIEKTAFVLLQKILSLIAISFHDLITVQF